MCAERSPSYWPFWPNPNQNGSLRFKRLIFEAQNVQNAQMAQSRNLHEPEPDTMAGPETLEGTKRCRFPLVLRFKF